MDSPLTPEPARSTWVADAERYDHWFESPWGRYAFATERQAILAAAGNLAGKTVADIGCGTGRFTTDLEHHAGRVVGLDPDPSMLAVAARRAAAPLIVGDGNRLPFRRPPLRCHHRHHRVRVHHRPRSRNRRTGPSHATRGTGDRRRPQPPQPLGHRQPAPVRPTPVGHRPVPHSRCPAPPGPTTRHRAPPSCALPAPSPAPHPRLGTRARTDRPTRRARSRCVPSPDHRHPRPILDAAGGDRSRYSIRKPGMARAMTKSRICSVPSKMPR